MHSFISFIYPPLYFLFFIVLLFHSLRRTPRVTPGVEVLSSLARHCHSSQTHSPKTKQKHTFLSHEDWDKDEDGEDKESRIIGSERVGGRGNRKKNWEAGGEEEGISDGGSSYEGA